VCTGDFDGDDDVDLEDFGAFQACLGYPYLPELDPFCEEARLDGDQDVDSGDFTIFSNCLSGKNVAPPPECCGFE